MLRWRQIAFVIPIVFVSLTVFYLRSPRQWTRTIEVPFDAINDEVPNPTTTLVGKPITQDSHDRVAPSRPSTPPPLYPSQPPAITIIAIWNLHSKPVSYLHNFFASVGANPQVDLLFVKYDRFEIGCDQTLSHGVSNIREICLSTEEYWTLHADFLCDRWHCDEDERGVVLAKLYERAPGDRVNSYFRPFRSAVFAKWVNPDTPIWGWCDMDTMLGDFERNFPWDVAKDFDVLVPSSPTHGDNILLFLPGHLAFFRNSPEITDQFMSFPNVVNFTTFVTLPWISPDSEEVEYSNFAFLNTNLTFLRFQAMVYTRYHLSSLGRGVYAIDNDAWWDLSSPTNPADGDARAAINTILDQRVGKWEPRPTFSMQGREYVLQLREGVYPYFLWFPKHFAVDFVPDYTQFPPGVGKRYAMRRAQNGPVTERIEPDDLIIIPPMDTTTDFDRTNRPFLVEFLYVHFQGEKYTDWWALPERPIEKGEVLFVDKDHGAQVWDPQGRIVFDTGTIDKAEPS